MCIVKWAMKVTYNSKLNAYQVIYKDELAEYHGKRPYVRKQISAGKKKPTASERKVEIRKWEDWATEQEEQSKKELEALVHGGKVNEDKKEKPILAAHYIANLKGEDLTRTENKKERIRAEQVNKDFVKFLNDEHKGIYLHQITKKIALEYLKWLDKKDVSYAYKKVRWVRLGYVFNMIQNKFEESEYKYRNPFYSLKIDKVSNEEPVNHKKTFDPTTIRLLLEEARNYNHTKKEQSEAHKIQRWAILYLLTLTGIRPKDIMLLKWSQVNLQRRTLTITHAKTKKKGINTVIWLTPHLMDLFSMLQDLHKNHKPLSKEYIFSFHPYRNVQKPVEEYLLIANHQCCSNFFEVFREKHNLTEQVKIGGRTLYSYCIYSLRATVGTILTWANFNQNSIDYLQGHAPNNTTSKFYLNHEANPRAATEAMINHMAYRVVQQPLGKVGLSVALDDYKKDKLELQEGRNINERIRLDTDGTSLLTLILKDKIDEERKQKEDEMKHLISLYGEEVANFLQEH